MPGLPPVEELIAQHPGFGTTRGWHNRSAVSASLRILTHPDLGTTDPAPVTGAVHSLLTRLDRIRPDRVTGTVPAADILHQNHLDRALATILEYAEPGTPLWDALDPDTQSRLVLHAATS